MTLMIPNVGTPRYIPKFNAMTDSPSLNIFNSKVLGLVLFLITLNLRIYLRVLDRVVIVNIKEIQSSL